jgi:hypothetical protein
LSTFFDGASDDAIASDRWQLPAAGPRAAFLTILAENAEDAVERVPIPTVVIEQYAAWSLS